MSSYTGENLEKLLKKDLTTIVLAIQSKMSASNAEVLEEIRKFNSKCDILQSELLVTKKLNSELSSRLVNMERQCRANAQYSRRECLEVVGVPRKVEQKDLESKVLSVLEKVGCKINPDNIEGCHRLSKKSDNIIIRFSRRKDCQHVLRVKKDLQNVNLEVLAFHGENKIYINWSLCQYYQMLWSKSKKLHSMGRIHSFYIAGESVKIKVHENSTPLATIHVNDFEYHFTDVDLSPTSTQTLDHERYKVLFSLCVISLLYCVEFICLFIVFVF